MSGRCDGTFTADKLTATTVDFGDNAVPGRSAVHRFSVGHQVVSGTAVLALANMPIHYFRNSGKVLAINVVPFTAPTGGDLAYTVDLKKGNQATPVATILSSVVTINSSDADRQANAGTLSSSPTTCAAGDFLSLTVALTGSTGTQGQGYVITVDVEEDGV